MDLKELGRRSNCLGALEWTGLRRGLFYVLASLFAIAFTRKGFLCTALFARFEVEGVTLDLLNNVLLLDFPLKAAQRAFQGFPILHEYFSQSNSPRSCG